ncbi:MAG: immunoglobulin domain-containing protein [Verrucomicrobiae bacterium]|nr:immunoglobulin domain-containing protein [Verrucomicrobiae bacterium]
MRHGWWIGILGYWWAAAMLLAQEPFWINIVHPTNGQFIAHPSTPLPVTVQYFNAEGTVVRVDYYRGKTYVGESTNPPFTLVWSNPPAGTHLLRARATDNNAVSVWSPTVEITINAAPQVTLARPREGELVALGLPLALTVTAADEDGSITNVTWYVDDRLAAQFTGPPYDLTLTNLDLGPHSLRVEATDNWGETTRLIRNFQVIVPDAGFTDDFEPGVEPGAWAAFAGALGVDVLITNYAGAVSGVNSLWFGGDDERYAITRPLSLLEGARVSFQLRYAAGGRPVWGEMLLPDEAVQLEYRVGDNEWTVLEVYTNAQLTNWTYIMVPLPPEAISTNTQLRWHQPAHSGIGYSQWALDDVTIHTGARPPTILRQPANQVAKEGDTVVFEVEAEGSPPLAYRWMVNQAPWPFASGPVLVLEDVSAGQNGWRIWVEVSNPAGVVTSAVAWLTVAQPDTDVFRIVSFATNNAVTIDHDNLTGDDRGGLVVSSNRVFITGDNNTAHYDAGTLGGGVRMNVMLDGLVADLRTEKIYSLAQGTNLLQSYSVSQVDGLLELDGATGAWTGRRIAFNLPIPINYYNAGVFSGSGRVLVWASGRLFHIALPDGTVTDLGALSLPQFYGSESWAIWGIAECFSNALHLVYVRDNRNIVRSTVGPGTTPGQLGVQTTVLQNFFNLGDMANIALSLSRNRWYFHHEAGSQFRPNGGEILGYAPVTVERNLQAPPFIIAHPVSQYIGTGGRAILAVSEAGALPRNYQWYRNGQPLTANTNRLVLNPVQSDMLGDYYVVVSNPYGSTTSQVANVLVGTLPVITRQPGSTNLRAGETLRLRVEAEGTAPLWYAWYFQGYFAGYTNAVLTLPDVTLAQQGNYYVVVSNYFGAVTSQIATVTVLSPPVIVTQPADISTLPGADDQMRVTVNGTAPFTYQWFFNGAAIPGATNETLKLSGIGPQHVGSYHVVITNLYGAATSRLAELRFVQMVPNTFRIVGLYASNSKTMEHEALTGDDCGGIALSRSHVFVTGDNRTGRWLAEDLSQPAAVGSSPFYGLVCNLRTETVYSFAQGTTLITGSGQRITHLVELHGTNLTQTGRSITLSQPITNSYGGLVCSGFNRVGLYINSTRLYYDIELPSGRVTVYGPAPQTADFYIYGSETWASWGVVEYYDGVPYLVYCTIDWNTGLSSINRTRVTDWQTSVVNNFESLGDMANFTVSIPRRRWYFHHESGSQFRPEYGETVGYADAAFLFVDATNAPPEILQPPTDQMVALGGQAQMSVMAYGGEPLSYQWRLNGTNVPNATSSLLVITNVGYQHVGDYTVVVSNAFGMAIGGPARLAIDRGTLTNRLLIFGITNTWRYNQQGLDLGTAWRAAGYSDSTWSQGRGLLAFEDNPAVTPINTTLSLTAPGGGAITTYYFRTTFNLPAIQGARQVRLISSNLVDDGAVIYINGLEKARIRMNQGTVTASTFASISAPEGVYDVLTLDTNGVVLGSANLMAVEVHQQSATSSDVVFGMALFLEVVYPNDPPIILQEPQDVEVDYLGRVQLAVSATGMTPLSYQWYQGNMRLPAFTGPVLEMANVTSFQAGNYRVVISNAVGVVTSRVARVTVRIPPEIWDQPQGAEGWVGNSLTLFVTATGTDLRYQWWHNGAALLNATNAELSLAPLLLAHAGDYFVVVSNASGVVTSQVATVIVHGIALPPENLRWSNGVLRLAFDLPAALSFDIEASEDLRQWQRAASFTNHQGRVQFEDHQAVGRSRRFYRLRLLP